MVRTRTNFFTTAFSVAFVLCLSPNPLLAEEAVLSGRVFSTWPQELTTPPGYIYLRTDMPACILMRTREIRIDADSRVLDVSFVEDYFESSPCVPAGSRGVRIPLHAITESGLYTLRVYDSTHAPQGDNFSDAAYLGSFDVSITAEGPLYNVETPVMGSTQSGVGVVRGWACDAQSIEVSFNGLPRMQVAWGSSRGDTLEVCGDENNGYGLVIGWSILGPGMHNMRTYIDGVEVAEVEFEVAGLKDFTKGLSGSYELKDFPAPGQSVVVRWSEADQNFIIVEQLE